MVLFISEAHCIEFFFCQITVYRIFVLGAQCLGPFLGGIMYSTVFMRHGLSFLFLNLVIFRRRSVSSFAFRGHSVCQYNVQGSTMCGSFVLRGTVCCSNYIKGYSVGL